MNTRSNWMSGRARSETPAARDGEFSAVTDFLAPMFELPPRVSQIEWVGHIPFLFLLFKMIRPQVFLELGVHSGTSFLAACEAARRFKTGTKCYGIDTWRGDRHTNPYDGDPIYNELLTFTQSRYIGCELIRSTFDDAKGRFDDGSVDVLHIDGLHTYEAVSHDFRNWRSKLSNHSIVLFHDITVKTADFGVWKFWDEIKTQFRSLEFLHSYGLGVVVTGGDISPNLDAFLQHLEAKPTHIKQFQELCEAISLSLPRRLAAAAVLPTPTAQRTGRNDPCPCNSGRKYKHCHGQLV
jgi:Methyltransferase domain/SEC-C motif